MSSLYKENQAGEHIVAAIARTAIPFDRMCFYNLQHNEQANILISYNLIDFLCIFSTKCAGKEHGCLYTLCIFHIKQISLVRLQNFICALFYQTLFLT